MTTPTSNPAMPVHTIKVDDEVFVALLLLQIQYAAGRPRVPALPEVMRQLLDDCRPDLMGIDPPLRFSSLTRTTRRRCRWLLAELMRRSAVEDWPEPVTFDTLVNWLIDQTGLDVPAFEDDRI